MDSTPHSTPPFTLELPHSSGATIKATLSPTQGNSDHWTLLLPHSAPPYTLHIPPGYFSSSDVARYRGTTYLFPSTRWAVWTLPLGGSLTLEAWALIAQTIDPSTRYQPATPEVLRLRAIYELILDHWDHLETAPPPPGASTQALPLLLNAGLDADRVVLVSHLLSASLTLTSTITDLDALDAALIAAEAILASA